MRHYVCVGLTRRLFFHIVFLPYCTPLCLSRLARREDMHVRPTMFTSEVGTPYLLVYIILIINFIYFFFLSIFWIETSDFDFRIMSSDVIRHLLRKAHSHDVFTRFLPTLDVQWFCLYLVVRINYCFKWILILQNMHANIEIPNQTIQFVRTR